VQKAKAKIDEASGAEKKTRDELDGIQSKLVSATEMKTELEAYMEYRKRQQELVRLDEQLAKKEAEMKVLIIGLPFAEVTTYSP